MTTEASEAMNEAKRETGHGPLYMRMDAATAEMLQRFLDLAEYTSPKLPEGQDEVVGPCLVAGDKAALRNLLSGGTPDAIRELVEAAEAALKGATVQRAGIVHVRAEEWRRLHMALQRVRSTP